MMFMCLSKKKKNKQKNNNNLKSDKEKHAINWLCMFSHEENEV